MSEITVTIKYGSDYDDTWAVFKGSHDEVRSAIIDYFALDADVVEGLSLSELVVDATQIAQGKATVARVLGAVATGSGEGVENTPYKDQGHPADKGEPAKPAEPEQTVEEKILEAIEAATTEADMKRIYAENTAVVKDDKELAKAWKAKYKEVKGK